MEKRKIQKTGLATFTVSLPKAWIVKNSLTSGDEISIYEERNGCLSVNAKDEKLLNKGIIIVREDTCLNDVIRKVISMYTKRMHNITINSINNLGMRDYIMLKKWLKRLTGFEIVIENDNQIVIQDFITSTKKISIIQLINRAFNISCLILKETINMDNNLPEWMEEVENVCLFLNRQLNLGLHSSAKLNNLNIGIERCLRYIKLIHNLEKMTSVFYELSNYPTKSISQEWIKQILLTYHLAYKSIINEDFIMATEAFEFNLKDYRSKDNIIFYNQKIIESIIKDVAWIGINTYRGF
jgi:phosphate uptake regulator